MKWPLATFPIGKQRCVQFQSLSVLVCRTESGIFAVENRCPHAQFPLLGGIIKDGAIRCPTHGAKFDLRSGEPLTNRRLDPVTVFPVTIEDDWVILGAPEDAS
jgi:nitrite reductase/ring-hydroxylating ferredoxin subunit